MIYVCEHHDAVLAHWRARDLRGISLAHVDFHDDLRGLLIDRKRSTARMIGEPDALDAGNFLTYAVLERRLRRVTWVHDTVGGRAWDMGIVRYTSDLLSMHQRIRLAFSAQTGWPLEFDELLLDAWSGPQIGETLSVDWDCFASILQDADGIAGRVDRFFERLGDARPADSYVAYSPEYCHASLEAFRAFVSRLASRFEQEVEWLDPDLERGELHPTGVETALPGSLSKRAILFLRRRGIY